jgi:hypothetical protein
MSATIGTFAARQISFIAAVDSSSGHETRTMSAPASSRPRICSIVAFASDVGVLVIDWTVIGASPADQHIADADLARLAPRDRAPGADVIDVLAHSMGLMMLGSWVAPDQPAANMWRFCFGQ